MTCAACGHVSEPTETVRGITICSFCLASVKAESGARATGFDTTGMAPEELKQLRRIRSDARAQRGVAP